MLLVSVRIALNIVLYSRAVYRESIVPWYVWKCYNVTRRPHEIYLYYALALYIIVYGYQCMWCNFSYAHYNDVIMGAIASQIISLTIEYSTVYSDADQRKHQSSVSLAFVWGIHQGPVNSPHKWHVTRKMFPFDDVIMYWDNFHNYAALAHSRN